MLLVSMAAAEKWIERFPATLRNSYPVHGFSQTAQVTSRFTF
jgi:hypothetical protein